MWKGTISGEYVRISIHIHQQGKDIPTGLFRQYIRDLKFDNNDEFFKYLKEI